MAKTTPMTEAELIRALKNLEARWPAGFWLFAAAGSMTLMRCGKNGEHPETPSGGVDPAYYVHPFYGIHCDGGDW